MKRQCFLLAVICGITLAAPRAEAQNSMYGPQTRASYVSPVAQPPTAYQYRIRTSNPYNNTTYNRYYGPKQNPPVCPCAVPAGLSRCQPVLPSTAMVRPVIRITPKQAGSSASQQFNAIMAQSNQRINAINNQSAQFRQQSSQNLNNYGAQLRNQMSGGSSGGGSALTTCRAVDAA